MVPPQVHKAVAIAVDEGFAQIEIVVSQVSRQEQVIFIVEPVIELCVDVVERNSIGFVGRLQEQVHVRGSGGHYK